MLDSIVVRAHTLHGEFLDARRTQRSLDHRVAGLLRDIKQERAFEVFGHANVVQYAWHEHQLSRRQTLDLLAIGRRLADLPVIDAALAAGDLDKTKAREILRVATPATEVAWLGRAASVTSRELERLVSASAFGDAPSDESPPLRPARVRRVFEMDAIEADLLDQALVQLRLQTSTTREEIDDGALLALLARQVLDEPAPDTAPRGGEPYRVIVQHCPACEETRSGDALVSDTIIDEALCDALLTDMLPGPTQGHVTRTIPPAMRTAVLCAYEFRCAVPGCRHRRFLDVHHLEERQHGGDHRLSNLIPLCPAHHRVLHAGHLGAEATPDGRVVFTRRSGIVGAAVPTWVARRIPADHAAGRS
jgi:hypothetical protein